MHSLGARRHRDCIDASSRKERAPQHDKQAEGELLTTATSGSRVRCVGSVVDALTVGSLFRFES